MKAAQIRSYGGPEVIEINEIPKPEPANGQVLVEVHASSVNPFDDKVKAGMMQTMRPLDFPTTIGGDIAGVVVDDGGGFKAGDKVWGQASVFGGNSGAIAEYAATSPGQLGKMPTNLNFVEAGVLPLVGLSAVQALVDTMRLEEGQKILIHGAAGGIGSVAVQLAKHIGAYVYATTGPDSVRFVGELGADEVIDYKKEDFRTKVKDADAVFDPVGGETNANSYEVLRPGGIIVSMIAQPNEELMQKYNVRAVAQGTKTSTVSLDQLAKLVEKGAIKPIVEGVYTLDQTSEAFRDFEAGNLKGKIAIQVSS